MEDVMEPSPRRKCNTNGDGVDDLGDLIGPEEARLQLPCCGVGKGRDGAMTEAQQHRVSHRAVLLVVLPLLDRLCLFQPETNVLEELLALSHSLGHNSNPRFPRLIRADGRGITAIDNAEGRVTEGGLVRRVVDELCPREPPKPLTRAITCETAKVHGDDAIGRLSLAFRLWVEGRRHVQLGPHEPHQLAPKRRGEDGIPIGQQGLRHPMEADDVGEESLSDGLCRVWMSQWNKMTILAEAIHHGEDDGFAPNFGQSFHEVEPNVRPHCRRHGQRQKESRRVEVL